MMKQLSSKHKYDNIYLFSSVRVNSRVCRAACPWGEPHLEFFRDIFNFDCSCQQLFPVLLKDVPGGSFSNVEGFYPFAHFQCMFLSFFIFSIQSAFCVLVHISEVMLEVEHPASHP